MAQPSLDEYLGTCPGERVGEKITERFTKWRSTLNASGQYAQWVRNYSMYCGGPGDLNTDAGWADGFALDGENSEILSIRINEMRNLITHVLNLTYSKPVGLRCIAENGESASLEASIVGNALLDGDFKSSGGTKLMRRCGEGALVVSTSFALAEWDFSGGEEHVPDDDGVMQMTGSPRLTDFWIDEVCFDGTKKDWRDVYDVILLRRYNRFELASRKPKHAERILTAASVNKSKFEGFRWQEDESDDIVVFEYLHRAVNANFLPDGRRALCLDDGYVIEDGPNPYAGLDELNIYPVTAAQGLNTVYGYAIANDLSPLNRFINLLATIIATNTAAYGSPNLVGPKLAMIDIQNIIGGGRYFGVSQGQDIKPLAVMPDMKPMAELMTMFSSYGEKMSGVAAVQRGEDVGNMSGKAIALIKSMAVQFMSSFQQSVVEQHESVGNALIWLRKTFSTGQQKVAHIGDMHAQKVYEYDSQTLGRIAKVRAEAVDPAMTTTEGREERADKFLQMGAIKTPWEYTTMIETGRSEPLMRADLARNLLIQRENSDLMKGVTCPVLEDDDHPSHRAEHSALLADPSVRRNDALLKNVLEHNALHKMFEMGLTPLQGADQMTGQPYPDPITQLQQAKQQAAQMGQQQVMQQQTQGQQQQQPPPQGQPPLTAVQSLQQGAFEPQPS